MGIERSATRWYVQRIVLESEAASLETKLRELRTQSRGQESRERAEIEKQLADVLARLHALGPCPKAMMG